jgi:type VI secretion system protein ImpB
MSEPEPSNADLLRRERASFANVSLPTDRPDDLGGGELPFIVGVIDDFAGNAPGRPRPPLEERTFDKVSRYTLDQKMAEIAPGLAFDCPSTLPAALGGTGGDMQVELRFNAMADFDPKRVAEQVPALAKLLRLREQLMRLRARAAADPDVRRELEKMIADLVPPG